MRAGDSAPGGGVFGPGSLSPTTLNDAGNVGFVHLLEPFSFPDPIEGPPFRVNAGVYRFSHRTHTATPVMRPGVTLAPGGELFAGAHSGASLNDRGDLVFAGMVPTDQGIHLDDEDYSGLGVGIFKANKKGHILSVVSPGDRAPGGGVFDNLRPYVRPKVRVQDLFGHPWACLGKGRVRQAGFIHRVLAGMPIGGRQLPGGIVVQARALG